MAISLRTSGQVMNGNFKSLGWGRLGFVRLGYGYKYRLG